MPHYITDNCTGCGVCAIKCPMMAIHGEKKQKHLILSKLCIDCSVCGWYCPQSAIENNDGKIVPRLKPKEIAKADIITDDCSGCENCIAICPFESIELKPYSKDDTFNQVAVVEPKKCVGCKLCKEVCIKEAINFKV